MIQTYDRKLRRLRPMAEAEIHELFNCLDCGTNTSDIGEFYMLRNDIWRIINPKSYGMLCIGCVEKRLGRKLRKLDFMEYELNHLKHCHSRFNHGGQKSRRLMERLHQI